MLQIEYIPIDKITAYKSNARHHGEKDIDAIEHSIREFGFNDPLGVWGKDNIIVEGHGRLMAAKRLGLSQVPVIRIDHLTEDQRRAYALAHNRTAELSMWDAELLDLELDDLGEIFDMELFGFDGFEPGAAIEAEVVEAIDLDASKPSQNNDTRECRCPKRGFVFEVKR